MLFAGQELADHYVGTTRNEARISSAAVFGAETLAEREGSAVRHGARLHLGSAMSLAVRFFSRLQTSGAACKLACSTRAMFVAKTACCSKSAASFYLAHFRAAATVLDTPSPCTDGRGAPFPSADWFGTVLKADTTPESTIIASFRGAEPVPTMFVAKSLASYVSNATSSRASHFAGMMETDPFCIFCVSEAHTVQMLQAPCFMQTNLPST